MSRFEQFTEDQRNVIEEALSSYTDVVISDDDFYDEEDKHKLKVIRDNLIEEIRSCE